MPSSAALRAHIEASLARRIPAALSPRLRTTPLLEPVGIGTIDELLGGGLPRGAVIELTGAEGSGRSSLALSFLARMTQRGAVCAWIDVSDRLHPESAAAIGVDLSRLLWVRCGDSSHAATRPDAKGRPGVGTGKPWHRMDQALRVADLLLGAGGFSTIVLDMGDIAAEFITRVPMSAWFRYRAEAERSQSCFLLLSQYSSTKSSAGLVLHFGAGSVMEEGATCFAGIERRIAIERNRLADSPSGKKPVRSERSIGWRSLWAGVQ